MVYWVLLPQDEVIVSPLGLFINAERDKGVGTSVRTEPGFAHSPRQAFYLGKVTILPRSALRNTRTKKFKITIRKFATTPPQLQEDDFRSSYPCLKQSFRLTGAQYSRVNLQWSMGDSWKDPKMPTVTSWIIGLMGLWWGGKGLPINTRTTIQCHTADKR